MSTEVMEPVLTSCWCPECQFLNVLDARASKCQHYCAACASIAQRLHPTLCRSHPERVVLRPQVRK